MTERQRLAAQLSDAQVRAYVVADLGLPASLAADPAALVDVLARRRMIRRAAASATMAEGMRAAMLTFYAMPLVHLPTEDEARRARAERYRVLYSEGRPVRRGPTPQVAADLAHAAAWGFRNGRFVG